MAELTSNNRIQAVPATTNNNEESRVNTSEAFSAPSIDVNEMAGNNYTASKHDDTTGRNAVDTSSSQPPADDSADASTSKASSEPAMFAGKVIDPTIAKGGVPVPFPWRLHEMLKAVKKENLEHIVCWQSHGRSFIVKKPEEFVDLVLTRFFTQSKYPSFQRQLNLYGFSRFQHGKDKGAYYHECFVRGRPDFVRRMVRRKIKGTKVRKTLAPDEEPDFYLQPAETLTDQDILEAIARSADEDFGDGKRRSSMAKKIKKAIQAVAGTATTSTASDAGAVISDHEENYFGSSQSTCSSSTSSHRSAFVPSPAIPPRVVKTSSSRAALSSSPPHPSMVRSTSVVSPPNPSSRHADCGPPSAPMMTFAPVPAVSSSFEPRPFTDSSATIKRAVPFPAASQEGPKEDVGLMMDLFEDFEPLNFRSMDASSSSFGGAELDSLASSSMNCDSNALYVQQQQQFSNNGIAMDYAGFDLEPRPINPVLVPKQSPSNQMPMSAMPMSLTSLFQGFNAPLEMQNMQVSASVTPDRPVSNYGYQQQQQYQQPSFAYNNGPQGVGTCNNMNFKQQQQAYPMHAM